MTQVIKRNQIHIDNVTWKHDLVRTQTRFLRQPLRFRHGIIGAIAHNGKLILLAKFARQQCES